MGIWAVEEQCEGAEAGPGAQGPSPGRGPGAQMDCGTGRGGGSRGCMEGSGREIGDMPSGALNQLLLLVWCLTLRPPSTGGPTGTHQGPRLRMAGPTRNPDPRGSALSASRQPLLPRPRPGSPATLGPGQGWWAALQVVGRWCSPAGDLRAASGPHVPRCPKIGGKWWSTTWVMSGM